MKKWLWQAILTIYLNNYRLKKRCLLEQAFFCFVEVEKIHSKVL